MKQNFVNINWNNFSILFSYSFCIIYDVFHDSFFFCEKHLRANTHFLMHEKPRSSLKVSSATLKWFENIIALLENFYKYYIFSNHIFDISLSRITYTKRRSESFNLAFHHFWCYVFDVDAHVSGENDKIRLVLQTDPEIEPDRVFSIVYTAFRTSWHFVKINESLVSRRT